jgi:hypothetical protein
LADGYHRVLLGLQFGVLGSPRCARTCPPCAGCGPYSPTAKTQNQPPTRACRFKSDLRHIPSPARRRDRDPVALAAGTSLRLDHPLGDDQARLLSRGGPALDGPVVAAGALRHGPALRGLVRLPGDQRLTCSSIRCREASLSGLPATCGPGCIGSRAVEVAGRHRTGRPSAGVFAKRQVADRRRGPRS